MATMTYFEEIIVDQNGQEKMSVEFGRSSFYANCKLDNGKIGTDSIYLEVDGNKVIMDRETATRFVEQLMSVARYHRMIE